MDINWICHDHFVIYTCIKLCSMPWINAMLYVKYILITLGKNSLFHIYPCRRGIMVTRFEVRWLDFVSGLMLFPFFHLKRALSSQTVMKITSFHVDIWPQTVTGISRYLNYYFCMSSMPLHISWKSGRL